MSTEETCRDGAVGKHAEVQAGKPKFLARIINFGAALAPVLIVMYIFTSLKSEIARLQSRMDALVVKTKRAIDPYTQFDQFIQTAALPSSYVEVVPQRPPAEEPSVSSQTTQTRPEQKPPVDQVDQRAQMLPPLMEPHLMPPPQVQPPGPRLPRVEELQNS